MRLEEIDKNFMPELVTYEGMTTYRLPDERFRIDGLYRPETGKFQRLPDEVARQCSGPLQEMYVCTSGGRIRFRTDSSRFVVRVKEADMLPNVHIPFTGRNCFDLYADGHFINAFRPDTSGSGKHVQRKEFYHADSFDSLLSLPGRKMREIVINMPLYSNAEEIYLALEEDAKIEQPTPYRIEKPVVFYGSSVTQGGCASHAGNVHPAILSRRLNVNFMNLGFSDGGRGEQAVAEFIASLEMSALVMEYDHNSRTVEHLRSTHEPFFQTIRRAQPDLPVIFTSASDLHWGENTAVRRDIVHTTYMNAWNAGDRKVWFIDGQSIFRPYGGAEVCTVDNAHPSDLGFFAYANAEEPLLREALGI